MIKRNLAAALEADARLVRRLKDSTGTSKGRLESGVYFSHIGLAREAMRHEFGQAFRDYVVKEYGRKKPSKP